MIGLCFLGQRTRAKLCRVYQRCALAGITLAGPATYLLVWAAVRAKLAQRLEQASALLAASSRARSQVFFSSYAATRAPVDPAVICAQPELANFRLLGAVRLLGEH